MSDIRFDNRVVIVTGAGAGIGKTYALEFAKRGAKVVVNDLGVSRDGSGANSKAADEVVAEIQKAGGTAVANYDSVATIEGGENIVKTAVEAFGKVDVLVNNAGILRDKTVAKMEEAEWDLVIQVHLKGAFCVTKPAMAIMREQKYGRIVFTTSGSGLYGNFGQANYSAAKMGLIGLMNVCRLEGSKFGIRCNAIAPAAASRMTEDVWPPEVFQVLKPEFITPLTVYLASETCQESGSIFNCIGGWYSKTAIVCAKGTFLGNACREVTAEEIHDAWDKISSLDGAKPLGNVVDSFEYVQEYLKK